VSFTCAFGNSIDHILPPCGSYAITQGKTLATFGFPQQEPFVPHGTCFFVCSIPASTTYLLLSTTYLLLVPAFLALYGFFDFLTHYPNQILRNAAI